MTCFCAHAQLLHLSMKNVGDWCNMSLSYVVKTTTELVSKENECKSVSALWWTSVFLLFGRDMYFCQEWIFARSRLAHYCAPWCTLSNELWYVSVGRVLSELFNFPIFPSHIATGIWIFSDRGENLFFSWMLLNSNVESGVLIMKMYVWVELDTNSRYLVRFLSQKLGYVE
jgi:hypothetical protein